jgi:hypothetical protein
MSYRVLIDDNFHYMDPEGRSEGKEFRTLEEAVVYCKKIVDDFLISGHRPGMTADELLAQYESFGEDPFVAAGDGIVHFSARDYATERAHAICGAERP